MATWYWIERSPRSATLRGDAHVSEARYEGPGGYVGPVEVESHWTWNRRERAAGVGIPNPTHRDEAAVNGAPMMCGPRAMTP